MAGRDLEERLLAYSLRIVRLCKKLMEKPGVGRVVANQLLKAGTSVGANYQEGQAGQSRADFVAKTSIALKEARETHYWLKLVAGADLVRLELLQNLIDETDQIKKILGAIVLRSRKKIASK